MKYATIYLSFDVQKYPNYSDIFFGKYEKYEKFNILAKCFEASDVLIKTIDVSTKRINMDLRCGILNYKDISERRDEVIEELLNKID